MNKCTTGFRAGGQPYPRKKPHHIKNLSLGKTVAREKPLSKPHIVHKVPGPQTSGLQSTRPSQAPTFSSEVVTLAQQYSTMIQHN